MQATIVQPDTYSIPSSVGDITYPILARICAALHKLHLPEPLVYDVLEPVCLAIDELSSPHTVAALATAWITQPPAGQLALDLDPLNDLL